MAEKITEQDAKDIIKAWEKLPGGKRYSVREVQNWLIHIMSPAINKLRKKLK
jgi:hypothetical protein